MSVRSKQILAGTYWLVTSAAFVGAIAMLFTYTPVERTMGPIQKIFYVHLPVAISTFFACLVTFVASIGYLTQRRAWWDDLASAAATVAVGLCSVVLITGMIWGRGAWGQWWTWSPRLTFSLVLWLLYVVYLMVRASIESTQRRAVVSAVYGVIAFLDVPLVYLSVRLLPDIHPTSIELAWPMKLTLMVWFVPVVLLAVGLVIAKYRCNRAGTIRRVEASDAVVVQPAPAALRWAAGGRS
jgi:heme exporter protein C